MIKNILIFRTDRIGDLLLTCPTIKTIKEYFPDSNLTVVASYRNFNYAKTFEFVDNVYEFPNKGLLKKIKFYYQLRKKNFDYIFLFDGKDRSLLLTCLLNSPYKAAKIVNRKQLYLCKLFKVKSCVDNFGVDLNNLHQKLLNLSGLDKKIENFDYLLQKKDNLFASNIPINEYIQVHLDEKWFTSSYIKSYEDINPSFDQFNNFINTLSKKYNVLISTGLISNPITERLLIESKDKISDKIYNYNLSENIIIVYQPTFVDLESILRKAKILISCHGALTHVAASFNIKIIDIVEKSSDELVKRYSLYIKNYYKVYRDNFKRLVQNINQKI